MDGRGISGMEMFVEKVSLESRQRPTLFVDPLLSAEAFNAINI